MVSPEILRRFPYFSAGGEDCLVEIALMADEVALRAGETLFVEGGRADHLYAVKTGEVNIEYHLEDGRDVVVDTLVAGELVGWSALLDDRAWTASCRANRDSHLIALDAVGLRDLCEENPELGHRVMREVVKALSHRLEGARVQLAACC